MHSALIARVGETELRLTAPETLAPRAWILGVAAVQVVIVDGVARAQLRAHVTGGDEPTRIALGDRAIVHVTLSRSTAAAPPAIALAPRPGSAQLALLLDGELLGEVVIAASVKRARAFGHVYCRWLRDGGEEPGCDLTPFVDRPPGEKHERLIARAISVGQTVSYVWSAAQ
jgi:hypothetical protein